MLSSSLSQCFLNILCFNLFRNVRGQHGFAFHVYEPSYLYLVPFLPLYLVSSCSFNFPHLPASIYIYFAFTAAQWCIISMWKSSHLAHRLAQEHDRYWHRITEPACLTSWRCLRARWEDTCLSRNIILAPEVKQEPGKLLSKAILARLKAGETLVWTSYFTL